MSNTHLRFNDDIDNYEPSDSEDEYDEREKALLEKARTKLDDNSDSEEEVYGLDAGSLSSENEIAESDIEKADDDDLPDVRAWGKSKRDFYSTDYVDQDFGGYQGKDATEAEFEETEARDIQKRLAEQLYDEDFSLDIFSKKQETTDNFEVIKSDLSSLSKRELHQLLQKESPEMFMLIEDCKMKMERVKSFLYPIIVKDKKGQIEECEAVAFVKALYHMTLNYSTNVYMYLLLKAAKVNVQTHPVLKRLYQYRQLIAQLDPIYNEIILPQIEVILNAETMEEEPRKEATKRVKKLKLLQNLDKSVKQPQIETVDGGKSIIKKSKLDIAKSILKPAKLEKYVSSDSDNPDDTEQMETQEPENDDEEQETKDDVRDTKRAITYQMQKNKGLTPHRKKEQRNPRVKHRNKFRKANIRRKGAVREVRKEISRYGGELSGIKASVSKSIKIK